MPNAVLDSTVLVSAFLKENGISAALLRAARARAFRLCLADAILAETQRVLLETPRIRRRYRYPDHRVGEFVGNLRVNARLVESLPPLTAIVRDPTDDMIVACAVAVSAGYVVTRDLDLLSLETYESIIMITPEAFMAVLRDRESRDEEQSAAASLGGTKPQGMPSAKPPNCVQSTGRTTVIRRDPDG